ncbi:MAG: CRTAC1 family protein [Planctomycetota bacterium]|jgi:hypothetical protein
MPRPLRPAAPLAALVLTLAACSDGGGDPSPDGAGTGGAPAPWFEEVAAESGLVFRHDVGYRGRYLMPESIVGGGALFDMDGDGDLDAYLVQTGVYDAPDAATANRLFRNRGDGTFEDVTAGSGADDAGYGVGVSSGDYDADGDVDLYVTNVGPNVLLRNEGDGRFTDVSAATGTAHPGWGASSAFVDVDHDGDLDLYVCNYVNWSPETELDCYNDAGALDYCQPTNYDAPARDVLYRNEGDGTFTDASDAAGLGASVGTGLGVIAGDFDGDGRIDVFVANDGMRDHLWINRGDGTFTDEALESGCGYDQDGIAKAGMGVTAADVDDDGDLDLLVCNLNTQTDSFFLNEGNGLFADVTAAAGLGAASRPFTRFGMAWIDFDHDGRLDLFQANGRVMRQSSNWSDDPYAEPNLLLRGVGGLRFTEVKPRGGTAEPLIASSRAAAFGDVDDDGDVDVLVVNRDGPAHLLRNVAPRGGAWIGFRVVDEHDRDALGAVVSFRAGPRHVRRDVRAAFSFCASNDPRVHVGLGDATGAEEVEVRWVDGRTEAFGDRDAGAYHTLRRGAGRPVD